MNNLNDRKIRLKNAERVRHYEDKRRSASILDSPGDELKLKPLSGKCPPFNRAISWVCDSLEKKAYMIGGRLPSDKAFMPTSDFYCLDLTLMRWTNLTDSLKYRDLEFPFSSDSCQRNSRGIPELTSPGHTLFRIHKTSFLLLFGGYDAESEKISSKLLVIDLRHLEWWYQPVEGGIATGRIDPTMVAIDRKLFIFGGYKNFEGNGGPHASYSIVSLSDDDRVWSWELVDVPNPNTIPLGTILGRATTIYEGTKILLTSWRTTNDNCFDLGDNSLFCFHIERRKFQLIDIEGDFPKNLDWYSTFSMPSLPAPSAQEVSNPRPGPSHAPQSSRSSQVSSAIICGWMDWADNTICAEVWRLILTPTERIHSLNISPIIAKLDSPLFDVESDLQAGLQDAVMIGEQLFLLGSRPAHNSNHPSGVLNRYLEVPLRRLCARNS